MLHHLMIRFMDLPHSTASLVRIFLFVDHFKTKTNSLKPRLSRSKRTDSQPELVRDAIN